jgi:hypothetical protein
MRRFKNVDDLEYTNVITNPILLVLCYTFSNPGDIPNFLLGISTRLQFY